jgi:uncharacterized protein
MASWLQNSLLVLVILGMAVGLFGLIIPFFPGVIVIWLSILGYGLYHGFTTGSGILFGVITILMIFSTLVDNLLMGTSARQKGTSWLAIILGMITLVIASIFVSPLGGLLISFGVVFLVELIRQGNPRKALESLKGMLTGFGLTFVARFGIGLLMIGLWAVWFFLLS